MLKLGTEVVVPLDIKISTGVYEFDYEIPQVDLAMYKNIYIRITSTIAGMNKIGSVILPIIWT